jgi:hypothetical protein
MAAYRTARVTRTLALVGAVATGVLLTAGCSTPGATHTVDAVTATITIAPDIGEIFAPAPASARPALTAQQAWAEYTHHDASYRKAPIPSSVTVHLGLLTLPLGPSGPGGSEAYTARNELAYGYSWHSCPASRNPRVRKLPPNPCTEWNFLNANTGHQLDDTWQI